MTIAKFSRLHNSWSLSLAGIAAHIAEPHKIAGSGHVNAISASFLLQDVKDRLELFGKCQWCWSKTHLRLNLHGFVFTICLTATIYFATISIIVYIMPWWYRYHVDNGRDAPNKSFTNNTYFILTALILDRCYDNGSLRCVFLCIHWYFFKNTSLRLSLCPSVCPSVTHFW